MTTLVELMQLIEDQHPDEADPESILDAAMTAADFAAEQGVVSGDLWDQWGGFLLAFYWATMHGIAGRLYLDIIELGLSKRQSDAQEPPQ